MIDYNNIYVVAKETGPSKKHGSSSLSNGSINIVECNVVVITMGRCGQFQWCPKVVLYNLFISYLITIWPSNRRSLKGCFNICWWSQCYPPIYPTLGKTKSNHLIVQSIKFGVSTHLTNGHSSKHANGRKVAKNLGLDWQCIY